MTDIKPELIEKARLLTDWSQHEYRVDRRTRVPRCVCGWTATKPYDVEGFDRHITETVLATVADDLRAEGAVQALLEAADAQDADPEFRDPLRLKSDWLRARADRIEARDE